MTLKSNRKNLICKINLFSPTSHITKLTNKTVLLHWFLYRYSNIHNYIIIVYKSSKQPPQDKQLFAYHVQQT